MPYILRRLAFRRAARDLERLAQVSPHLLSDLGFTRDAHHDRAGRTIWRRGVYVVTVDEDPEGGTPRVDISIGPVSRAP